MQSDDVAAQQPLGPEPRGPSYKDRPDSGAGAFKLPKSGPALELKRKQTSVDPEGMLQQLTQMPCGTVGLTRQ